MFFLIFQKVITDIVDQLIAYPSLEELCGRFCIILEKEISKAGNHTLYACADPENFLRGVQISRRGLTENFNMANINNLAIPGGGGGVPDPLSSPLDPPMV